MSDREEHLFNWFCYRLPKALQTVYLHDLADGKIKGYKQAKKWLEREEELMLRNKRPSFGGLSLSCTTGMISSYTTCNLPARILP